MSSGPSVAQLPSGTVVQVKSYAITRALLNQWLTEEVGEDYYDVATHRVPPRLVAEPANYPACVSALRTVTPFPGEKPPVPQPTLAQLMTKCRDLYKAIKKQATAYLVSSFWTIDFAAAHGITVTREEVEQGLERIKAARYPRPGEFQRMLASRRRTLQQELFIVRNDLVQQKVLAKLLVGDTPVSGPIAEEAEHQADSAICRPGYIVEHCRGYKPPKATSTDAGAASLVLEEIARWRPETSHGFTGKPVTN